MTATTLNAKWLYKVDLKDVWKGNRDQRHILNICRKLIPQLGTIETQLRQNTILDEADYYADELCEIKDRFEFLRDLAIGDISENEWDNYSFDGDFVEMFDECLEELYAFGDQKPVDKNGIRRKLLWIGTF